MMEVPYHYQFRIIVIGDTMVGKSSLLKTFSEGAFGEMEPTVGVDFFSKIIEIKPKSRNKNISETTEDFDKSRRRQNRSINSIANSDASRRQQQQQEESIIVKLQIWDTAGQERFKSIVTSYYRNSVGIVLVYDVTNRDSYEHLLVWFNEACRHVEPSPLPSLSPKIFINRDNQYPLTSTPNATMNGDNTSLSFNSLTSDHHNRHRPPSKRSKYKMAYLVIGCKTDLESQRQVSYEDGQALADAYGFKFIETSSKMYYNVNQAFQLLAEEIYDKISESGRLNHLTFDGTSTNVNEGIRLGPLIENSMRHGSLYDRDRIRLLEAQPVSGFLGGCC